MTASWLVSTEVIRHYQSYDREAPSPCSKGEGAIDWTFEGTLLQPNENPITARLQAAERQEGPTLFDELIEIILTYVEIELKLD